MKHCARILGDLNKLDAALQDTTDAEKVASALGTSEPPQSRRVPPPATGSVSGFWRSARGENHGRDSRPGDVWVEQGDITDTDRLDWMIGILLLWGPRGLAAALVHRDELEWPILDRRSIDAAIMRSRNTKLCDAPRSQ